jgi:membrane protease YdiL (CAAX protease family)
VNTPEDSALPASERVNDHTLIEAPKPASADFDPDNPPWGLLQAIPTWLLSVLFSLVVPLLCVFPYIAIKYRGEAVSQQTLINDKTYWLIVVIGFFPAHLLTIALAWAVASRVGKLPWIKTLGFSWPSNFGIWKTFGLSVLVFLVATALLYGLGGQETELERILRSSRATALVMAFLATVTAPLSEEVIYRGILYPAIRRWTGAVIAVMLVTLIFASLHVWQYWPNAGAISGISLVSLVLTAVRARTGKLLPCFVIHLVFNGIQSIFIVADPYLRPMIETPKPEAAPALIRLLMNML